MVKGIKRRVKLDSKSYHTSLEHFKKGGNLYRPIVGILEKAYSKLIRKAGKSNAGQCAMEVQSVVAGV